MKRSKTVTLRLQRSYEWFRSRGHRSREAISLARAERYLETRCNVGVLPEEERYEDVYGEKPPPNTDFLFVFVDDVVTGESLGSLGFVEDDRARVREEAAAIVSNWLAERGVRNQRRVKVRSCQKHEDCRAHPSSIGLACLRGRRKIGSKRLVSARDRVAPRRSRSVTRTGPRARARARVPERSRLRDRRRRRPRATLREERARARVPERDRRRRRPRAAWKSARPR